MKKLLDFNIKGAIKLAINDIIKNDLNLGYTFTRALLTSKGYVFEWR